MLEGIVHKRKGFLALVCGVFFAGLILAAGFGPSIYVSADISNTACQGFDDALGSGSCGGGGDSEQIDSTLSTVVNILSIVVGVIAVFMIIIAGIRYITSNGDPGATKTARDTIIYAIIGLMIVALAQAIVRLVLTRIGEAGGGGGPTGPLPCGDGGPPPC